VGGSVGSGAGSVGTGGGVGAGVVGVGVVGSGATVGLGAGGQNVGLGTGSGATVRLGDGDVTGVGDPPRGTVVGVGRGLGGAAGTVSSTALAVGPPAVTGTVVRESLVLTVESGADVAGPAVTLAVGLGAPGAAADPGAGDGGNDEDGGASARAARVNVVPSRDASSARIGGTTSSTTATAMLMPSTRRFVAVGSIPKVLLPSPPRPDTSRALGDLRDLHRRRHVCHRL
jgi:hypothetical protein